MLQSCNISKTSSGSFSQFLIFKEPYPVISQEMQVKPYCSVKNESPVYLPHWILFASLTDSSIPYLLFSTTRLRGENNGERLFTEEPPGATRYSRGENSARLYVSDNIFWLQPGGKHNEDCTVEKWFIFFYIRGCETNFQKCRQENWYFWVYDSSLRREKEDFFLL